MKRKYVFIVIMSLAMGLAGCSSSQTPQTTDTEMVLEKESPPEAEETTEEITTEDTEAEDTSEEETVEEVTVSYEMLEDEKTLEDGTVILKLSYQRPTVTVAGKEDVTALIKQEFDTDEEASFVIKEEGLQIYTEAALNGTMDEGMPTYSSNHVAYSDKRLDERVISFEREQNSFLVGMYHGQIFVSGLNFDTQTGEVLNLEAITEDKEEFLATARDYILMLCETDEYKDILNPDYEEHVDSLLQEELWYFDEQGITFIANPYEMAAYAAGTLYFTVPYDELQGVKAEYLK